MSEIVKCSNRNCGLITDLSNWIQVKDKENPRVSTGHCPRCLGSTFFEARPGEREKPKSGAQLNALERNRQTLVEGWSPEHDDQHKNGELSLAGASYAALAGGLARHPEINISSITAPRQWPWEANWWKPSSDNIKNLVRAGALIAAEIDRLQRLQSKTTKA